MKGFISGVEPGLLISPCYAYSKKECGICIECCRIFPTVWRFYNSNVRIWRGVEPVYNLYAYFHDLQTFTHYAQDYQHDLYSIKPYFIILIVYDFNSIFILSYRIVIVNL